MYKKPVIVFEGIEGSGKTHHINLVSNYLKKKRIDHIKIREPGGNKNSEKIRNLILSNKSNFNNNTDLLLYLAARSENIEYLKKYYKKRIILIDRFIDSTIAYQVYGKKVDIKFIDNIHKKILQGIKPNIVFILKVSQQSSRRRLKKRKSKNRYDNFAQSFYNKAQKSFIKIAKNKKNYFILDSSNNDNFLEHKIFDVCQKYLNIK